MNCLHKGCESKAVTGGQFCYYSHDGTLSDPTLCMVETCKQPTHFPSNLCQEHQENYYAWRKRTDLSKIKGESSMLAWLVVRSVLRGAK